MPEGRIILAQAAVYVATAPKSNACYIGIDKALEDIKNEKIGQVPIHLRDAHYSGADKLGHGKGYKYPHDYDNNFIQQQYLPDNIKRNSYYNPTENGYEKNIKMRLMNLFKENN